MATVVVKTRIDPDPNSGSGFNTESYLIEIIDDVVPNQDNKHVYDLDGIEGILHNLSFNPTWIECVGVCCHSKGNISDNARVGIVAECFDTIPGDVTHPILYRYGGNPALGTGRVYLYLTNGGKGNNDLYFIKLHIGRTHSIMD